jgi:hypothetical protein
MLEVVGMDLRAIRTAPPIPDLDTASPRRIDHRNARLDLDEDAALAVIAAAIDIAHHVAGDRSHYVGRGRGHKVWGLRDEDAEQIMREHITAATVPLSYRLVATRDLVTRMDRARRTVREIEQERAGLAVEFRRRGGWSRFFTVPGGHVHSGQRCVGGSIRPSTRIGWNPELSGKSEAEALTHFGALGHVMCTHCFPHAPVIQPLSTLRCPGSGKPYRAGTRKPRYPNGTGECTSCGTRRTLTPNGNIRAHQPPAPAT